ncbi:hypothetical protein F4810DRAFT_415666 [Camillea tinctor]|nr:hypothetical protein F4810DRAFT_415666 [Camillea tinctor]
MTCPPLVTCPASSSVIPTILGTKTGFVTSELAGILTYIPQNNEYTWTTYTYLPATRKFTAAAFPTISSSHSTQQTSAASALEPVLSSSQSDCHCVLDTAETAGVAVACAIVGAICSAIIALFFVRLKRQRWAQTERLLSDDNIKEEHVPTILVSSKAQSHDCLLDRIPDRKIGQDFRSLEYLIKDHVQEHYHLDPVQCDASALALSLVRLGLDQDGQDSLDHFASLALDPSTRYKVIRHIIAKVVFTSVTLGGNPPISLLPTCIAEFMSLVPPTEDGQVNPDTVRFALTRWRQLSAFLLCPNRSDRSPLVPSEDISTQQAQELTVALNKFLEPFITGDREDRYEQENNLREMIVECATFGYALFSQPSGFRFVYGGNEDQKRIAVFPGIERISDEDGRQVSPLPQPIVGPVIENI